MTLTYADRLTEAGMWLKNAGDIEGAREKFEHALRVEPTHRVARLELQSLHKKSGVDAGAMPANQQASGWDIDLAAALTLPTEIAQRNEGLDMVNASSGTHAVITPVDLNTELTNLLDKARDLQSLDDHSGALSLLERLLSQNPSHPMATEMKARSEHVLLTMYESKLGDLKAQPRVLVRHDDMIWLNLDHRAGFILAQMDGKMTLEDMFEVSGFSRLDMARILAQLLEKKVITLVPPAPAT